MTPVAARGPIVIDTDIFSSDLTSGARLAELYAPIIVGRSAFISFQTATELRYGAARRGWGVTRMTRLEAKLAQAVVVHSGDELVAVAARLRADCAAVGHARCQKQHTADLWIASTAIRLGMPLVSNDGIFRDAPGLTLETIPA